MSDFRPFLSRTYRIEWGHCDPAGIVYAPRFFEMFGESTIILFERALGIPKREMLKRGGVAGFPAVQLSAEFLDPVFYGEEVLLEAAAPQFGQSSFVVSHRLRRGDTICVTGTEKRVWTVPGAGRSHTIRSQRVPDDIRVLFAGHE